MGKDLEILAGLMAVQLRLVPGPRFVLAAAQCEADPAALLTRRLIDDRDIGAAEMASILMLASGQVRQHDGDETAALAAAPIEPKMIDALLECGPSPKMKGLLRMLKPGEKIGTSVLPGQAPQLSLVDSSELDEVLGHADFDLGKELRPSAGRPATIALPATGALGAKPAPLPAPPAPSVARRGGTLTVRTRAFACDCVREGRDFNSATLIHRGLNVLCGIPAGRDSTGPPRILRLKAHAPECTPAPLPGAQVWLFRYDLSTNTSTLTTPSGMTGRGKEPLPVHLGEALFARESRHTPLGPGVYLGKTPVEGFALPAGSWMLLVWLSGRNPLRVPVRIGVTGECAVDVTLSLPTEVPPKFAAIPEGPFLYQGDAKNPQSEPVQAGVTPEFLLAKVPVTAREYAEFLNSRAKTELDFVVRKSAPRDMEKGAPLWPGPPYAVPTAAFLETAAPELRAAAKILPGCSADWNERWPIVSISWVDAMRFCEWKRDTTGWLVMLPHEIDWEKAARGVDGRTFPWGNVMPRGICNASGANPEAARPSAVDDFPADESPYGILGLGGNARDMCMNEPGPEFPGQRVMRGGYWAGDGLKCHSSYRTASKQDRVSSNNGFRLMCLTRVSSAADAKNAVGQATPAR